MMGARTLGDGTLEVENEWDREKLDVEGYGEDKAVAALLGNVDVCPDNRDALRLWAQIHVGWVNVMDVVRVRISVARLYRSAT